jgi:hypothetical protein
VSAGPSVDVDPDPERETTPDVVETVGPGIGPSPSALGVDVDEDTIVRNLRQPDLDADQPWERLPALKLPGFGQRYESCGDDVPHFCASCGEPTSIGRTCRRSTCPRCAPAWARKRAASAAGKLDACRRMRYASEVDDGDHERMVYHHLVVSPTEMWGLQEEDSDDVFGRTTDRLTRALEAIGAEGYYFYHPWRGRTEEAYDDRVEHDHTPGDDLGAWKKRLFSDKPWDDVRGELEFSPHFHVVAVAPAIPGGDLTSRIYDETGWVIHRITKHEDSSVSIGNDADLLAVLEYCLSHTGLRDMGHQTRSAANWFGSTMADAQAQDHQAERLDAISRSVAPRVLGLEYNSMACAGDHSDGTAGWRVSDDLAAADRSAGSSSAFDLDPYPGGARSSTAAPGELPDQPTIDLPGSSSSSAAASSSEDVDVDDQDGGAGQRCNGRLLHIREAPQFLEDDDWCADAPFVEQLQEAFEKWDRDDDPADAGDGGEEPPPDHPEAELSARDLALFDPEHQVHDS